MSLPTLSLAWDPETGSIMFPAYTSIQPTATAGPSRLQQNAFAWLLKHLILLFVRMCRLKSFGHASYVMWQHLLQLINKTTV